MLFEEGVALWTAAEVLAEGVFAEEGEGVGRRGREGLVVREVGFGFLAVRGIGFV